METKELIQALREDAEWAHANEWETPITLGDHLDAAADALAAYEDTELTPKEVKRMSNILLDVGIEYNCSREYVKNWLLDDRLRELDEADKDGRVVVLPCKVG